MDRRRRVGAVMACGVLAWLAACGGRERPAARSADILPNGMNVLVERVPGARRVALVVLFGLGGDHDPEGKSGLAHLVEHLWFSAAAGAAPSRTFDQLVRGYPDGWNAQTGDRYTVLATVFPRDRLDGELREAALRMSALRITADDLAREKARIVVEVGNMFDGIPALAAANLARERVRPSPAGARKGGVPEQVEALTLDEVTARWAAYYQPRNAIVVIAGDLDPAAARAAAAAAFGSITPGEPAPVPWVAPAPRVGGSEVVDVTGSPAVPELAAAWRAPPPSDPDFPAFLVLYGWLAARGAELPAGPGRFALQWPILDDPDVVAIGLPTSTDPASSLAAIDAWIARVAADGGGRTLIRRWLFADDGAGADPYAAAFAAGRLHQLGVDRAALRAAFDAVSDRDAAAASRYLTADRRAVVIVR